MLSTGFLIWLNTATWVGDDVGAGEMLGLFVSVGDSVGDAVSEPPPQTQHMSFEEKSESS